MQGTLPPTSRKASYAVLPADRNITASTPTWSHAGHNGPRRFHVIEKSTTDQTTILSMARRAPP
eukprot:2505085-Pyramimonas_sp.AAC.1